MRAPEFMQFDYMTACMKQNNQRKAIKRVLKKITYMNKSLILNMKCIVFVFTL